MPSFSKTLTSLTGFGFGYFRDSRHAAHVFGQDGTTLDGSQPRFGFEYYVKINMIPEGNKLWGELVKGDPNVIPAFGIKSLIPDVVTDAIGEATKAIDGAVESIGNAVDEGINAAKEFVGLDSSESQAATTSQNIEALFPLIKSIDMPSFDIDTELLNEYNRKRVTQTKINYTPFKMVLHDTVDGKTLKFWQTYYEYYFKDGKNFAPKFASDKIILPQLFSDTHGYNISQVGNKRNLIESIEIYQVHATKFHKVTLVNPRVSAFNHETLAYDNNDILELNFTFEYEYARYNTGREKLPEEELEKYDYGDFMDPASLAIGASIGEALGAVNPLLKSENPIVQKVGKSLQSSANTVINKGVGNFTKKISSSVQNGMANIEPTPRNDTRSTAAPSRSFKPNTSSPPNVYNDVSRGR